MAIIKKSELKDLGIEELEDRETQIKKDVVKIKGVLASGGIPENIGKLREMKRTLARIQTLKKGKKEAAPGVKAKPKTKK